MDDGLTLGNILNFYYSVFSFVFRHLVKLLFLNLISISSAIALPLSLITLMVFFYSLAFDFGSCHTRNTIWKK
jgi:hypothetical protein